MTNIKKMNGFSLIELVVVIVILGILAAFAVPKFANLSKSADRATLEAAAGAAKSAMAMIYSKAIIDGIESEPDSQMQVQGETIRLTYGYPIPADIALAAGLSDDDFVVYGGVPEGAVYVKDNLFCFFFYTSATATTAAKVTIFDREQCI